MEAVLVNAWPGQPTYFEYQEYSTSENFSLWLSGFYQRVRAANGFKLDEDNKVKAEIIRSIAANLSVGTALDTYDRLTIEEKADYDQLTHRLAEEFIDKHEKRRFIDDKSYNKRKKGQKLEDFIQEIKNDVNRYAGLHDAQVPNPEKEKEGVRRFKAGIRNSKGKKDKDLSRHLRYYLVEDDDFTWENALKITERWEMATLDENLSVSPASALSPSSASSSSSSAPSSSSTSASTSSVSERRVTAAAVTEGDHDDEILNKLAKQIEENRERIERVEIAQNEMIATLYEIKETLDNTVQETSDRFHLLMEKLEMLNQPFDWS